MLGGGVFYDQMSFYHPPWARIDNLVAGGVHAYGVLGSIRKPRPLMHGRTRQEVAPDPVVLYNIVFLGIK